MHVHHPRRQNPSTIEGQVSRRFLVLSTYSSPLPTRKLLGVTEVDRSLMRFASITGYWVSLSDTSPRLIPLPNEANWRTLSGQRYYIGESPSTSALGGIADVKVCFALHRPCQLRRSLELWASRRNIISGSQVINYFLKLTHINITGDEVNDVLTIR